VYVRFRVGESLLPVNNQLDQRQQLVAKYTDFKPWQRKSAKDPLTINLIAPEG